MLISYFSLVGVYFAFEKNKNSGKHEPKGVLMYRKRPRLRSTQPKEHHREDQTRRLMYNRRNITVKIKRDV